MKKIFLILTLLIYAVGFGQKPDLPKNPKTGEKYVRYKNSDGTLGEWKKITLKKGFLFCKQNDEWIKIKKHLSKKEIISIQKKLHFLGYSIIKTGVYDTQTKREIQKFNNDVGLKNYAGILELTQKKLSRNYRKKKKNDKRVSRKY